MNTFQQLQEGNNDAEKKQMLSQLMADLAVSEEMLHQFKHEKSKSKADSDSERYLNACSWIEHYSAEIQRLTEKIKIIERELLGEEQPRKPDTDDTDIVDQVRITHPDITEILKGIAPLE